MKRCLDLAPLVVLAVVATCAMPGPAQAQEPGPWPPARAAAWAREQPWLVGCNDIPSTAIEPPGWFHDIFRADGTSYDAAEVAFIRKVTGKPARSGRP